MDNSTSRPETVEAASAWAAKSELKDENGVPTVFYHGSPHDDLDELEHGTTAFGIFSTPDPDTASYYATGNGKVYAVLLNIAKLADLDDEAVFNSVAREAVDYTECRDEEAARRFAARLYDEGYLKNEAVREFFDKIDGVTEIREGYTAYDLLCDECTDSSDIEALVETIASARVTDAFNAAAPKRSDELEWARAAYGTNAFYLDYQDDFMRAAQALGYDGVVFNDPSSTGQPISYVVFRPEQVVVIDDALAEELREAASATARKLRMY